MRRTLATAPPWVVTALSALVGIAFMTVGWANTEGDSWLSSFVFACIATVISAPFTWTGIRRARRETRSITGPLTRAQQQSVYRAAATGVPPTDTALRRPALDLARHQLTEAVRQRIAMTVVGAVVVGLFVLFAITDRSLWLALLAVPLLGALGHTLLYPARQRRRVARLEQASGTPGYAARV